MRTLDIFDRVMARRVMTRAPRPRPGRRTPAALLERPLEELPGITARALKVLCSQGASTFGDLVGLSVKDLRGFRNCGETTLRALRLGLFEVGLRLKYDDDSLPGCR